MGQIQRAWFRMACAMSQLLLQDNSGTDHQQRIAAKLSAAIFAHMDVKTPNVLAAVWDALIAFTATCKVRQRF